MLEIEPGCEDGFRYLGRWLAASAALDALIEATEPLAGPDIAPPTAAGPAREAAPAPQGLRARLAARLARLALALHGEAAAGAVLRRATESGR